MDLVEDYLRAVGLLLPEGQREDITAELRDVILSRVEAREAELGRPLGELEIEAVLREIGHPLVVAARYRGGPQHVVGPALYPYWAFAVKVTVTLQCVVAAVIFVLRALGGGHVVLAFDQAVGSALTGSATLVGIATVIAWVVERRGLRVPYLDRWRVRDLRGLAFVSWDVGVWRERLAAASAPAPGRRAWLHVVPERASVRAGHALGAIAGGAVLILWWTGILPLAIVAAPAELRDLGVAPDPITAIDWVRLKAALFWPVIAYGLAVIAQGVVRLARPGATRLLALFDLAIAAGVLITAIWLWTGSPLMPFIQADSVAQFALRLKTAFGHGAPIDPTPILSLLVISLAFGAVVRAMRGAWAFVGAAETHAGNSATQLS